MREKLTMLVVDDVEVNRTSLKETFQSEYEVVEVNDGVEAMLALRERKIDIVILDLFMPNLDGGGVLKQMKAEEALCGIPVIVKTAVDENMEAEMLRLGADDFIFSPFDPAVVKKRVKNLVDKYILERAMMQKEIDDEKRLSKVRDSLIVQLSEELRSPIHNILDMSKEGEGYLSDVSHMRELFTRISQKGKFLLSVVDDIMEISGKDREEMLVREVPFHLNAVVENISDEMYARCKKKGIHFEFEISNVLHEELIGDPKMLGNVWYAILDNAYKYTKNGGYVRTSLQERKMENQEVELVITVQDNGAKRRFPLVRSMVELMGGSMTLATGKGDCATFILRLPYRYGKEEQTKNKKFNAMRAMVFDDDEITCNYQVANLARLGIHCEVADNSEAVIKQLSDAYEEGKGYDICFVNWYMPGGAATVRKIREYFKEGTLLIVCTSSEVEEVEKEMKADGVDFILKRPVLQSALYTFMAEICKK